MARDCYDKFNVYFLERHPGMSLDGPTAQDELTIFRDGYIAGMEHVLNTLHPISAPPQTATFVDHVLSILDRSDA